MAKQRPAKTTKEPTLPRTKLIRIGVVAVGLIAVVLGVRAYWNSMLPPPPPTLTPAQNQAVVSALTQKGYPAPKLELHGDRSLVATFMIDDPKSPAYLKGYATETLMTIKDALQPKSPAKSYQVNIKGASPDPEMTISWGHGTYSEGDTVHWMPGH